MKISDFNEQAFRGHGKITTTRGTKILNIVIQFYGCEKNHNCKRSKKCTEKQNFDEQVIKSRGKQENKEEGTMDLSMKNTV
jgi:hypothetical protein